MRSVNEWLSELESEEKAHKEFRERARKVVERYEDEAKRAHDSEFNILWSNTEVLHAALYARTPTPDIRRRHLDKDRNGKMAAEIAERAAAYCLDTYDFDAEADNAIDDYLLSGLGVIRLRYVRYSDEVEGERRYLEQGEDGMRDGDTLVEQYQTDADGFAYVQDDPYDELQYEEVISEWVGWERFRWQPAARWGDVSWAAIEHYMRPDELEDNFGKVLAKEVPLTYTDKGAPVEESDEYAARARVYEIFDKKHRRVIYLAEGYHQELKSEDDPLKLENFYPFPKPLLATTKNGKLIPIPDYVFYQDQAKELDRVTDRINRLTEQLKYRGVYDASFDSLRNIEQSEDGEFVPVADFQALVGSGGQGDLNKVMATVPTDELVRALQALYASREEIKQTIYEITGIADIMRGSSKASETLGAQQLKTQFGSMRLQKRQRRVAAFMRALVRLKVEIMVENFDPKTLALITGMDIPQAVYDILTSDLMRSYRIDIETDSTIAEDAQAERQGRVELVTAVTTYMEKVAPMVQAGLFPRQLSTELLGFAVRGFKVGRTLEDTLDEMSTDEDPRMRQLQEQFQGAMQQMKGQAEEQVQQIQSEAGKKIQELEGKLFDAQKKGAITSAVNEAKMFETQTRGEIDRQTKEYQTQLNMLLEVFKAQIQQSQQEPIDRMNELGGVLNQIGQIIAEQDQRNNAALDEVRSEIANTQNNVTNIIEFMKKPAKIIRDKNGRVTGASRE